MMKNALLQSPAKKGQPSRAEITDAAMGEPAECVMLMPFLWLHSLIWDARMDQADFLVQDNARLSEELLQEQEPSMARVQARKIVMEDRRWYASKVLKRVYGDDPALSVNTQVNVSVPPDKLASIRERLEHARTLVPPRGKDTPAAELEDAPPAPE